MYAIIQTGGKQYKVSKDDTVFVEKLSANANDTIDFDVVAVSTDDGALKFGSPFVTDAKVTGELLKNGKGKKISVFTYKSKKSEKRKMGHRQPYSKVMINEISYGGKKSEAKSTTKKSTTKKSTAKSATTKKAGKATVAKEATKKATATKSTTAKKEND